MKIKKIFNLSQYKKENLIKNEATRQKLLYKKKKQKAEEMEFFLLCKVFKFGDIFRKLFFVDFMKKRMVFENCF